MSVQRRVVVAAPENSETPLASVRGWVTPRDWFFVRNHFEVPTIDLSRWRLRIEGIVDWPVELSWEDIVALPQRTMFATVECAGNGRSFLAKREAGVQWGAGAIGHGEWTGVPVSAVLERAGLEQVRHRVGATDVVFEGADRGSEADHPEPMPFARSLPLEKAMHPDTLLVTHMNGEPLEPSHGFPLRLFVPGWYGVSWVKWLARIEVRDRPFGGYFETTKYTYNRRLPDGRVTRTIVGPMMVKSEIVRPAQGEQIGAGTYRVLGLAWAGEDAVERVDVSVDGGTTWRAASMIGPRAPYSWCLWEYPWTVEATGTYAILARATTAGGAVQPTEHDPLNGGYLIHFSRPTVVEVRSATRVVDDLSDPSAWRYDLERFSQRNAQTPLDVMMEDDLTAGAGI